MRCRQSLKLKQKSASLAQEGASWLLSAIVALLIVLAVGYLGYVLAIFSS